MAEPSFACPNPCSARIAVRAPQLTCASDSALRPDDPGACAELLVAAGTRRPNIAVISDPLPYRGDDDEDHEAPSRGPTG